jgi:uncharacterized DUF497 family protein
MLRFGWDEKKDEANKKKHGVSFEEAQSVFFDEDALEFDDPEHSEEESRFLIIGKSYILRVLLVCHCYRGKESMIRIISARKATSKERSYYYRKGKTT